MLNKPNSFSLSWITASKQFSDYLKKNVLP